METRQRNERLAAALADAGFSHKGFAAAVRSLARERGEDLACDHTSVKRWIAGGQPRGDTPQLIAEALSRRLGRTVNVRQIGMGSDARASASLGLEYAATLSEAISTTLDLSQRDLGREPSVIAAEPRPDAWDSVVARWLVGREGPAAREDRPICLTDIQAVKATTDALSRLDYQFGGGQPRSLLTRYLMDEIAPLLRVASPSSAMGREFVGAVGALLRLIAWTAYDTGAHGLAQRYFIQALRLAKAAGDHALGGRILAGMSHQATYLGHFGRAADLARAAQLGAAKYATPTGMALFFAMEARALSAAGDGPGCMAALNNAVAWHEKRNPENDPDWLRYFDESELSAEWAHCLRDLDRPQAEEYARRSLELSEDVYVRSTSFVRTVLATSCLQRGHVDQAVSIAIEAAEIVAHLRSERCQQYLRDFAARLAPYSTVQVVEEFFERMSVILSATRIPA